MTKWYGVLFWDALTVCCTNPTLSTPGEMSLIWAGHSSSRFGNRRPLQKRNTPPNFLKLSLFSSCDKCVPQEANSPAQYNLNVSGNMTNNDDSVATVKPNKNLASQRTPNHSLNIFFSDCTIAADSIVLQTFIIMQILEQR